MLIDIDIDIDISFTEILDRFIDIDSSMTHTKCPRKCSAIFSAYVLFPPYQYNWLVGGLEHFFIFPYIGNFIIPIDLHIFQRGKVYHQPVAINPTFLVISSYKSNISSYF